MPKTCPKTVLPEPRPESSRRRRFLPIGGARPRRDPATAVLAMPPRADREISLQRRLGGSSVVDVWCATIDDSDLCVVKLPAERWSGHGGAARLVEREAAFLRRAAHAGVVQSVALLPMETGPGLVTEFLPGGDLVSLAGSHPRHWAGFVRDVVRALAHVHGRGIVHGDVKPRNVLVDDDGRARLIDFGIACEVGATRRAGGGTAAYRNAAQRRGAPAGTGDDIHALAVMIYELLCGRLPFGLDPDARVLETPLVPPLQNCPAYTDEPVLLELAALVELLLTGAEARDRSLDALDALLTAIIAAQD